MAVPPQPNPFVITGSTMTIISGDANHNGTGGLPMLQWQLGWSTSPGTPVAFKNLPLATGIDGIVVTPGEVVFFWNRIRTAAGWSKWSGRTRGQAKNVPQAPTRPAISEATRTYFRMKWEPNGNGGSPITGYRITYGLTNPPTTSVTVPANYRSHYITNLAPGGTYHVQIQAQNAYGLSPKTAVNSVSLSPSTWVKDGDVYRRALPYVKHNGVWYPAEPFAKIIGMWKRTG